MAEAIVARPAARIDVVDTLVRRVTFSMLGDYLGVPEPPGRRPARLGDAAVRIPVRRSGQRSELRRGGPDRAGAARAYPERDRARRIDPGKDDVLSRCLALQQKAGDAWPSAMIRSAPR
jgi:cytochrome P450